MASARTTDDWLALLRPALAASVDEAGRRLTDTPAVQDWLREASLEAAAELSGGPDVQAQAQAHQYLRDDLRERLPALVEAVRAATDGLGRIELHWRPLAPQYSRLFIAFDTTLEIDVFHRLPERTPEALGAALEALRAALPRSAPFPRRPHRVTALVASEGRGLPVRMIERLGPDGARSHAVTLLPPDYEALDGLSEREAGAAIRQYFDEIAPA